MARQDSLSINNYRVLPKLMSIESVMPSNHLILCCPLLLLSIFPSIRILSNESALRIRWPKYWSFSINIRPSNEHPGLISFRMDPYLYLRFLGHMLNVCFQFSHSVVSDSLQPHRRQPTRLPHPWDSPGKNTGVGCHFLLQ